jgi:hypothetical protein
MRRPLLGAVAILFLATVPLKVSATAYVSNLGAVWQQGGIGDIEALTPGAAYAGSFSTGAGAFNLNFVSLEFFDSTPQTWNNVVVQLYQQVGFQVNFVGNLGNPVADAVDATLIPEPCTAVIIFGFGVFAIGMRRVTAAQSSASSR